MVHNFKLIFISTLMLILILSTNTFAETDSDRFVGKDIENILNYFSDVQEYIWGNTSNTVDMRKDVINQILTNLNTDELALTLNENINKTMYPYMENITLNSNISVNGNYSYINLFFMPNNNTIGNIDYFIKATETQPNSNYVTQTYTFMNNNQEKITPKIQYLQIKVDGTYSINELNTSTSDIHTLTYNIIDVNSTGTVCNNKSLLGLNRESSLYFKRKNTNVYSWYLNENYINVINKVLPDIPENPESGDEETPTISGDYGEILDNINTGIGEINNNLDNISGELSNINNNLTTVPDIRDTIITNDDITSNLDFEFEQDPYTNFWFELTTGLSNAFTNSKREISIQFRDKTHIISLDNFSVQLPPSLKPFLTIISTVFITWKMLQYIKIIIDNISSGNIDEVLEMNEEEGITNLF